MLLKGEFAQSIQKRRHLSCCKFIHFNIFVINYNSSNDDDDDDDDKDFVSGGWYLIAKDQ